MEQLWQNILRENIRQCFIFSIDVRVCSHSSYLLSFTLTYSHKINSLLFLTHPVYCLACWWPVLALCCLFQVSKCLATVVLMALAMFLCWFRQQTIYRPSVLPLVGLHHRDTSGDYALPYTVRRGIYSESAITISMLWGRAILPSTDMPMFFSSTLWLRPTLLNSRACFWYHLYLPLRITVSKFFVLFNMQSIFKSLVAKFLPHFNGKDIQLVKLVRRSGSFYLWLNVWVTGKTLIPR